MKTKKLIFGLSAIVLAGSLMLTGCKKSTATSTPDTESGSASDNTYAENTANDITNIGSQASESGGTSLSTYKTGAEAGIMLASNATLTIVGKVITVDFGPAPGISCADGRVRSGQLIYNFTASTVTPNVFRTPGFTFNVTTNNYVVDSYTVNIMNKTVTNTTPTGFNYLTTNLTWNINANIQIIKPAAGGTITWTTNRTITLLNTSTVYTGTATPINWPAAKIQLDGTASGSDTGGESFTATATAMVKDFTCHPDPLHLHRHPFISGTLDFKPGNRLNRHIDFGPGTCDLTAVLTINGQSYTFYLP